MGQAWMRNPVTYIRECAEVPALNIVWDRAFARFQRIDPQRHLELHYPASADYRLLLAGDQGTMELRRGYTLDEPYAVYPTWEYGDPFEKFEKFLAVPVEGQEHRVVVQKLPNLATKVAQGLLRWLADRQLEHPEAIIHLHGVDSWRAAFGFGFGAADIDARTPAAHGSIYLPNGKQIMAKDANEWQYWINLLGFRCSALEVPRNRCLYNIKSAQWAASHWEEMLKVRVMGDNEMVDVFGRHRPKETKRTFTRRIKPREGDKLACDYCSLAPTCKYFRDGGVCVIPETDGSGLARMFNTRDSDRIIDGLQKVMVRQAERADIGMAVENVEGELNSEVTKILNSIFANGVKLAKLVNPQLAAAGASKTLVQINQNTGNNTPHELVAGIIGELEASGVNRDDITTEMVAAHIASKSRPAIEAHVADDLP